MRKFFHKLSAKIMGGAFLAVLTIAGGAIALATPVAPTQQASTTCSTCQSIQTEIDSVYDQMETVVAEIDVYGEQIESLLDASAEAAYGGDTAMMVDGLQNAVLEGTLATGPICNDPGNSFAYYSSFSYEGTLYCVINELMWMGPAPDNFNFFKHMSFLTEAWDPAISEDWLDIWTEMIELLTDYNDDGSVNMESLAEILAGLIEDLEGCEDENCPAEVECPDCETIAVELDSALENLADLENQADALDAELTSLDEQIAEVYEQLEAWDTLKAAFEKMVEDAGGKHGADCDGFEVESGQAWGIAHNFGNVQWCFTSEAQIEEMITNMDEYWANHKSEHLPSEADLSAQLDGLMNDYTDKLLEYLDVLDAIDAAYVDIEALTAELDECLTALAALQAQGYCLDQDIGPMEDILDEADLTLGTGFEPGEEPAEEQTEEPAEEEAGEQPEEPDDVDGHWAEDFIHELFNAGIVSGDDETGDFRPDEAINRAEAAKIVSLAKGDTSETCDATYFPDVLATNWFCIFTTNAFDKEYFTGYEDGTFGPANPILRAEAAAVVLRALGFEVPEYESYNFPDLTGDEWYADYAQRAYECGLFEGRMVNGEKVFAGDAQITRAEMAKIVNLSLVQSMDEQTACGAG